MALSRWLSNCVLIPAAKKLVGPAGLSRLRRALQVWLCNLKALRAGSRTKVRTPPTKLVGPAGFEPAASSSRTRRSTKLSHGPTLLGSTLTTRSKQDATLYARPGRTRKQICRNTRARGSPGSAGHLLAGEKWFDTRHEEGMVTSELIASACDAR